jgi:peptidyl-prolyl cis-trans isomerase A (cyclophilin A)
MRRACGIALGAAALLALAGCSSSNESGKPAAPAAKNEKAPEVFNVSLDTSKGPVVIEVHRDWAPAGADHFYSLVKTGYYDGNRFFRVVRNFVVQFGVSGDVSANRLWSNAYLPDDPVVKRSNVRGAVTYAKVGPNSRSTQLFINLKDNKTLDKQGFTPIGQVSSGMDVVDRFYSSYGEMPPRGQGPDPSRIASEGNDYLDARFPRLDYIQKAAVR